MDTLTPTESRVYGFMVDYQGVHNRPPTMEEIRNNCTGLAWRSSAKYVLLRLLRKGYLSIVAPTHYGRRYSAKEVV